MNRRPLLRGGVLAACVACAAAVVLVAIPSSPTAPLSPAVTRSPAAPRSHADDVTELLADPANGTAVAQLPGDRWVVPFRATEIGAALRMSGEVSETVVTLPVIEGTQPVSLYAQLTVSPDVDSGYIEYSGPQTPARVVDFDALGGRSQDVPAILDLRGMLPTDGRLKVTPRTRLRSEDPS